MSPRRRLELLKWADKENTFIVEDDYDHEFSNWENPITSIYGLDRQERVIYLGTFNKLLHPSIRMGYMIVPYYLLDTVRALYEQPSHFVPPSMQKTLSRFMVGILLGIAPNNRHHFPRPFLNFFFRPT